MKASFLKASLIILLIILSLIFALFGYKKETPPPPQELTAEEKEFLSAPDATVCELERIKISKLDLPKGPVATNFFNDMEQNNRHFVKQGQITLANRPFKIILGFHPEREFYICDIKKGFIIPYIWTLYSIHSYHRIDDELYEFMLIEGDTKIAARPYQGPLGTIKLGKGGRQLEKVGFIGSIFNKAGNSAPIGTMERNWPGPSEECSIPIGDYTPGMLYVTYDNLYIRISNNEYYQTQGRSGRKNSIYGIHVRQDKPYVLDFSNEPMVIFDQPRMSQTTSSRGDEIKFAAVLIDPKLNIMIERLQDTSVKINRQYQGSDGKIHTANVNMPLEPYIVIARANGEVIANSVLGTYGYRWRVPDDLAINGDEEELIVTVTYETQKLYGEVTAQRKIKIRKDGERKTSK